jgi:single-strand DNA-binding protein
MAGFNFNIPTTTYSGILHEAYDVVVVSANFSKREFVLQVNPKGAKYPEYIKFELTKTLVPELDKYTIGDKLTVVFTVKGRGYLRDGSMHYYNHLEVVKIEPLLY